MQPAAYKENGSRITLGAITVLYGLTVAQLGLQWRLTNLEFIANGVTRLSIFWYSVNGGSGISFAGAVMAYLSYILADGLLVSPGGDRPV